MKTLWRLFLLILVVSPFKNSFSQNYDVFGSPLAELYLYREPNAKADAMGRSGVVSLDNNFGSYYNPALTSLGSGITANASFSKPFYLAEKSTYNYFGVSYSDKKIGSIGLSRYHWNFGEDIIITDETGRETGEVGHIHYSLYTLNYSREIIENFLVGANIGYINNHFPASPSGTDGDGKCFTFDIGLMKGFDIPGAADNLKHSFQLGTSLINVTGSKISYADANQKDALPQIFRFGGSYNLKVKGKFIIPNSNLIETLTKVEYQKVLNSNYFSAVKFGQEFTLGEIFSLRAGYFKQSLNDFGNSNNASSQSMFTYGAGVKIPVNLIFESKTPIALEIDYVNLEQPSFINSATFFNYTKWDNYSNISLTLKIIPSL